MGSCCAKRKSGQDDKHTVQSKASNAASFSPDKNELRHVFDEFDSDGDGYIVIDELRTAMNNMGLNPPEEDVQAMFKAADLNSDGKISFEEFVSIARVNPMTLSLKTVFAELDVDGDGQITKSELKQAMRRMGHNLTDEQAEKFCSDADINLDGKLNYDEFVKMMCRSRK